MKQPLPTGIIVKSLFSGVIITVVIFLTFFNKHVTWPYVLKLKIWLLPTAYACIALYKGFKNDITFSYSESKEPMIIRILVHRALMYRLSGSIIFGVMFLFICVNQFKNDFSSISISPTSISLVSDGLNLEADGEKFLIKNYNTKLPFVKLFNIDEFQDDTLEIRCNGAFTTAEFGHKLLQRYSLQLPKENGKTDEELAELNKHRSMNLKSVTGEYLLINPKYAGDSSFVGDTEIHNNSLNARIDTSEIFGKTLLIIASSKKDVIEFFSTGIRQSNNLIFIPLGNSANISFKHCKNSNELAVFGESDGKELFNKSISIPCGSKSVCYLTINESLIKNPCHLREFWPKDSYKSTSFVYNKKMHEIAKYPASLFYGDNNGIIQCLIKEKSKCD